MMKVHQFLLVEVVIGLLGYTGSHHGIGVHAFQPVTTSTVLQRSRTVLSGKDSRRSFVGGAVGSGFLGGFFGDNIGGGGRKSASAKSTPSYATAGNPPPLADLPMVRLRLPQAGFGREYVAIKLKIQGQGPFDFMVDSGLTTELITPHLQDILGIKVGKGSSSVTGLAAGGGTGTSSLTDLDGLSLCCGTFATDGELPLPKLHAVITDFPQEHIDPDHDVEGMIGMELLSLFDVDFDFPNNRIRFWKPGTVDRDGLLEIPAAVINETGLIGIRLSVPGASQPILAFLDCGATFSCMNWKAAVQLGLPEKNDPRYKRNPSVDAFGVDGRLLKLPTIQQTLTYVGEIEKDPQTGRPVGFAKPPSIWKDWDPIQIAVGDIPAFSTILGDGVTPFEGPAALVGLDILSQRRVVLAAGDGKTRLRKVYISPK